MHIFFRTLLDSSWQLFEQSLKPISTLIERISSLFFTRLPENETVDEASLKKRFWTYIKGDGHIFFQLLAREQIGVAQKADHFFNAFLQKESDASGFKDELVKTAESIFSAEFSSSKSSVFELSDGDFLYTFKTTGDGSCGIHAVCGAEDPFRNNYTHAKDVKVRRAAFCESLKNRKNALPERIQNVLRDYYCFFNDAPSGFKTEEVIEIQKKTSSVEDFIQDETVFSAYIANLARTGTYLLQEELIEFCDFAGYRLTLYQPGWGLSADKICSDVFNEHHTNNAVVYYDGTRHYEKANVSATSPYGTA